jgi:hypothetical protein
VRRACFCLLVLFSILFRCQPFSVSLYGVGCFVFASFLLFLFVFCLFLFRCHCNYVVSVFVVLGAVRGV